MHHICAFDATSTPGANVEVDVAALNDSCLTIANGHFLPQRASQVAFWGGCSTTMTKARLSTPTLAVITTPFLRDLNVGTTMGVPMRFSDTSQDRIQLAAMEEIQWLHTATSAGAEIKRGLLGLMIEDRPQPAGSMFTIRGTAVGPLVAEVWSNVGTVTWTNQLPNGQYAIVGGSFFSAGAIAGRFILENWPWRPGCFATQGLGNMTDRLFRAGNLGTWGFFRNTAMPIVEMLAISADAVMEITMDIIKVG
jgi:hypothetical protein